MFRFCTTLGVMETQLQMSRQPADKKRKQNELSLKWEILSYTIRNSNKEKVLTKTIRLEGKNLRDHQEGSKITVHKHDHITVNLQTQSGSRSRSHHVQFFFFFPTTKPKGNPAPVAPPVPQCRSLLCAVFPREELGHPAGLLRPPQRLPAVGPGRLDPGEDRPPGAARRRAAAARGAGPAGRGAAGGAHPQALQLIWHPDKVDGGRVADAVF